MADNIIQGAEPLYLKGNSTGLLFIHGFTASPFEGRELAFWLHEKAGWTISVPLLPGHGTSPRDLKNVTWLDWYRYIRGEYLAMLEGCQKIFVCGQSMGGTLAMHLASHHHVDGLITLAGVAFLKDWRLILLPLARHILTYHFKSRGPDIRNRELKDSVPTYRKYPVKSVDQLLSLLDHTRIDLMEIIAPALLIHSRKDRTVNFENLNYIYNHISSEKKQKVILEESYHVISIDVEKEIVFEKIFSFISQKL
ncbi:MAG: alpha/beta fold hydrolase [Calditrichaeota bacterium]|nr:alpha/beta fold hydrolase [Calditrichota bacterium]RQW01880.1 MAG: alpha/beta fold hydrolase [Calditrichota bacterium]